MNKKLITFLSVISLLFSLSLTPTNAAAKAGAKCTKAGATSVSAGKKYTCVKSGNKLVWNKGVTVKAAPKPDLNPVFKPVEPTPTPTPTATATPKPQKRTITCIKGKSVKKAIAISPKCPAGYKKKS